MAPIPGAFGAGHDKLTGDAASVFRQTQNTHEINETGGKVQLVAEFTGAVIIWEGVVVVMESFTWENE